MNKRTRPGMGSVLYLAGCLLLSVYFAYAAIAGDYGVFKRAEIDAQSRDLRGQLDLLNVEVAKLENLTRRLSDTYLDLDLLDERVRDVLGMIRTDEIVIR